MTEIPFVAEDRLADYTPIGWYMPGEAGMVIHADGSIEMSGKIHAFDPDCCYRGCDNCPTWNKDKK